MISESLLIILSICFVIMAISFFVLLFFVISTLSEIKKVSIKIQKSIDIINDKAPLILDDIHQLIKSFKNTTHNIKTISNSFLGLASIADDLATKLTKGFIFITSIQNILSDKSSAFKIRFKTLFQTLFEKYKKKHN